MPTFVAMSSLHLLLITSLSLPLGCAAFLLPNPFNAVLQTNTSPSNPALKEYSDAQANSFITHRLNIGESGSQIRLPIDNLKVCLDISPRPEKGQDGKPPYPVPLPGTDGPNPGLSSGAMALGSANSGTFVTHEGTQHLPLSDGSWEIVWRYGNPAGSIVFGFRVTREVRRNQAILPAGRLYLSYPIWTAEGIEQARSYVSDVKGIAEMYTSERDEHLRSAENTSNPLMKALKYRQGECELGIHNTMMHI